MPETAQLAGNAEVLTGRIAEYQELLDVLGQRPGLTVISGDPWSGTSALLSAAIDELHGKCVLVDARSCLDSRDLAMAIADTAVAQLAPDAAAWWTQAAPQASAAGLRLAREAKRWHRRTAESAPATWRWREHAHRSAARPLDGSRGRARRAPTAGRTRCRARATLRQHQRTAPHREVDRPHRPRLRWELARVLRRAAPARADSAPAPPQ